MKDYRLDPPEAKYPTCPLCNEEAEEFYFDIWGHIVGCDCCISTQDAVEYEEEKNEVAAEAETERRADMYIESRYDD